jgi:hypothetical protein
MTPFDRAGSNTRYGSPFCSQYAMRSALELNCSRTCCRTSPERVQPMNGSIALGEACSKAPITWFRRWSVSRSWRGRRCGRRSQWACSSNAPGRHQVQPLTLAMRPMAERGSKPSASANSRNSTMLNGPSQKGGQVHWIRNQRPPNRRSRELFRQPPLVSCHVAQTKGPLA